MEERKPICGIVMPISSIDGCDENHWVDVFNILKESIQKAEFEANLVSHADDIGIIQKRIIQNLYENPIVICDVSGRNPNVMFELGMRLAFDKPTIIIKDDITNYSFDTSPIEHLEYPRDLRFSKIVDFKEKLAHKIISISKKPIENSAYSPFLQHFGEFKVAKIDRKEVSGQEYIIDELKNIKSSILRLERTKNPSDYMIDDTYWKDTYWKDSKNDYVIDMCLQDTTPSEIEKLKRYLKENSDKIYNFRFYDLKKNHNHISIKLKENINRLEIRREIESFLKHS